MSNDPGLASDTCIFMEAVSGDGGTHNSQGVWWLSPDIKLTGPTSGPDKADPGVVNPVNVTFHRQPDSSGCALAPGTEGIIVELWVANPALAMAPNNPASTTLVESIGTPLIAGGDSHTQVINWTPPSGLPATDPQSPGHKCLIARCYPDPLIPDNKSFHVPDDPHVAQHNICVVPCDAPGSARKRPRCGLNISTINVHTDAAETVRLRATFDQRPDPFVRKVVLEHLRTTPGFKQLATTRPQAFNLELPEFPDARVIDQSRPGGCLGGGLFGSRVPPFFEAIVELQPAQSTYLRFNADIHRATSGTAFVFHIRQIGADGRDQGGLTVVMLAL